MQAVMGNKENVIVTEDSALVDAFSGHFETMWDELRAGGEDQGDGEKRD